MKGRLFPLKLLSFHFYATNAIIIGFLPVYLQYKGLNGIQIGWVLAVGPLASIGSQPFWGYMSDKYKTVRKILIICILGFLISSIIFFRMDDYYNILLLSLSLFFFSTPIGALTDSLSQRIAHQLNVSFGGIRVWGSIGFGLSSLTAGFVLNKFGVDMMFVLLLPLILLILVIVFYLKDIEYDQHSKVSLKDLRELLKNKKLMMFLCLSLFIMVTQRTNDSFIGLYIVELNGRESQIGLAWSMALLGEAIVFSLSYLWFRRYDSLQFIIFASVFYTIRWFSYTVIKDPNLLLPLQLLNGPSFAVFYLSAFSYITKLLPAKLQSTGHMLFTTFLFGVSGVISSLVGGTILDKYGGSVLYSTLGFTSASGFVLLSIYFIIIRRQARIDVQ